MNTGRFLAGLLHGVLGGLLGLGGAAWRVPRAAGLDLLRLRLRMATSLVVVVAAWLCRAKLVPLATLAAHLDVVLSLVAGSLAGAWWRANARRDWHAVMLLLALALTVLILPASAGGVVTGLAVGLVMGCDMAAGLLLLPAIVVLYGLDIAVAGSLALMVSAPLLVLGLVRASAPPLPREQWLSLAVGAASGAALGTALLALLPAPALATLLAALLLYAALINLTAFFTKFLRAGR